MLLIGTLYMQAMTDLEGSPRDLWSSLEWAAETLTTTGYGSDTHWKHPLMVTFVIVAQFLGLFLVFLLFPIYVIPFFEEHFEARLPSSLPRPKGERYVLIYRYGPAVSVLIDELARYGRRVVVNDPLHRQPLTTWGATAVDTPAHVLASALASRASQRIRPTIRGVQHIVAVGREPALESLSRLAIHLTRRGPIVIAGFGEVGGQVQQMLTAAGEKTVIIDHWTGGRTAPGAVPPRRRVHQP